jgi:hypothetical protein
MATAGVTTIIDILLIISRYPDKMETEEIAGNDARISHNAVRA